MLKNYFSVALRNILKQKTYSLINISGLAIGMASCILILLFIENEKSYDNFHLKKDRIYKVYLERIYPDHITNYAIIPVSYAPVLLSDIPGIKNVTRAFGNINNVRMVHYVPENQQKKSFEEKKLLAVDSSFLDIFTIKILSGNGKKALSTAGGMIVTEETAKKYFGNDEPLGKILTTDFGTYSVMAVSQNIPETSHFDFDFLYGLVNVPQLINNENFVNFSVHTYLELNENSDPAMIESKIPELVKKYAAPQIQQTMDISYDDYIQAGNGYNYKLTSLSEIHLNPTNYQLEFKVGGNKNDVIVYFSIAILILIIAGINFTNLSVARSTERAREVGIRKTLGSYKSQLIGQFLTESIIMSLAALIIAVGISFIVLPQFNSLVEKDLSLPLNSIITPILVISALLIGVMAGSYPAFVISNINTISVLKGGVKKGKGGSLLRNNLVTFQFLISISLIVCTLIMNDQMNFIKNSDLGYTRENILVIERAGVLQNQQKAFINELKNTNNVINAAASTNIPANQYFGISFQKEGTSEPFIANGYFIDDEYIETHNFTILDGDGFGINRNDSLNIIINEEMARLLSFKNPVGEKIKLTGGNANGINPEFTIIGVVKNFHYMTMKENISPFVMLSVENISVSNPILNYISIKLKSTTDQSIAEIKSIWNQLVPEEPLKYSLLTDELDLLYSNELKSGEKLATFASLAIIISCIGLFGLSAYTTGLRIKEIGIRKVLGASTGEVSFMLTFDFLKWVGLAFIIALPLSYIGMTKWLENFAYRVDLNYANFIIAGLLTMVIAILTVSFQSIKAALMNPVKSLRSE
ncbi:MAG: ABC transporter permease [Cyclobacteriaceae bacterium]|nr:ABC transporter permease [Cyclobacteriaceae bacterium]